MVSRPAGIRGAKNHYGRLRMPEKPTLFGRIGRAMGDRRALQARHLRDHHPTSRPQIRKAKSGSTTRRSSGPGFSMPIPTPLPTPGRVPSWAVPRTPHASPVFARGPVPEAVKSRVVATRIAWLAQWSVPPTRESAAHNYVRLLVCFGHASGCCKRTWKTALVAELAGRSEANQHLCQPGATGRMTRKLAPCGLAGS
jgi:hypothetical protein